MMVAASLWLKDKAWALQATLEISSKILLSWESACHVLGNADLYSSLVKTVILAEYLNVQSCHFAVQI